MSAVPQRESVPFTQFEQLREAREILRLEADALQAVSHRLDTTFCDAVELLQKCRGRVMVLGMGKAGLIGRKIAATMSSTGTRAQFLHPADAVHGDLGAMHPDDIVLILSNSGETDEIIRLIPMIRRCGNPVIAVTGRDQSTLSRGADVAICFGRLREVGFGLAPTTSTTAMLAIGDALALVTSRVKGFTPQQFALYHPAGSLGQKVRMVREVMRTDRQLRLASETQNVREVFAGLRQSGRRTGAVMLLDQEGALSGLFTDSDLAKLLETRRDGQLDRPISEVMTRNPFTISPDALLAEAVELLSLHHLSELPVVDDAECPVGMLDITDIIGMGVASN
jgi:arabinose-5-phosphate isomerase